MGGNGIDDVFACQRDASADNVYAQDTYNPEDQSSHRSNERDSVCYSNGKYVIAYTETSDHNHAFMQPKQDQNGFHMTASSYDNGRITCSFTRSVLAENLSEDRNLNESAYLLLAVGTQRGRALHNTYIQLRLCRLCIVTPFINCYTLQYYPDQILYCRTLFCAPWSAILCLSHEQLKMAPLMSLWDTMDIWTNGRLQLRWLWPKVHLRLLHLQVHHLLLILLPLQLPQGRLVPLHVHICYNANIQLMASRDFDYVTPQYHQYAA